TADWQQLINSGRVAVPDSIPGATPTEKAANYASTITGILKAAFPGAFFALDLQRAAASSTNALDKAVSTFLNNAADAAILNTNLTQYLAQHGQEVFKGVEASQHAALPNRLATWQRVARVTADFPTASTLLAGGFNSAYAIASSPRAGFVSTLGDTLGDKA